MCIVRSMSDIEADAHLPHGSHETSGVDGHAFERFIKVRYNIYHYHLLIFLAAISGMRKRCTRPHVPSCEGSSPRPVIFTLVVNA
jgi:hypothetical protein